MQASCLDNLLHCPSVALEDAFEIISEMIAKTIGLTLRKASLRDQTSRNFNTNNLKAAACEVLVWFLSVPWERAGLIVLKMLGPCNQSSTPKD